MDLGQPLIDNEGFQQVISKRIVVEITAQPYWFFHNEIQDVYLAREKPLSRSCHTDN